MIKGNMFMGYNNNNNNGSPKASSLKRMNGCSRPANIQNGFSYSPTVISGDLFHLDSFKVSTGHKKLY